MLYLFIYIYSTFVFEYILCTIKNTESIAIFRYRAYLLQVKTYIYLKYIYIYKHALQYNKKKTVFTCYKPQHRTEFKKN